MNKYYPSYYKLFNCIAGECPDSCCKSWEIIIDEETCRKYAELDSPFVNKIKDAIITDSEGNKCFSLCDGICPFLNDKNLCDIHINLGEDFTSEICKAHPRFVEEYDSFTEISLSLSCPEANRIIFEVEDIYSVYPVPEYCGDDEVLGLLIHSRKSLLEQSGSFVEIVKNLLDTAADDSLDIDNVYIADFPEFNSRFIREYVLVLMKNEILTDNWKDLLYCAVNSEITDEELNASIKRNEKNLVKFIRYLLYRYYLKAVNDLDVYSRALFIISSCYVCLYLSLVGVYSFEECARLFSKETEHNTENIDNLIDYFSQY